MELDRRPSRLSYGQKLEIIQSMGSIWNEIVDVRFEGIFKGQWQSLETTMFWRSPRIETFTATQRLINFLPRLKWFRRHLFLANLLGLSSGRRWFHMGDLAQLSSRDKNRRWYSRIQICPVFYNNILLMSAPPTSRAKTSQGFILGTEGPRSNEIHSRPHNFFIRYTSS